MIIKKCFCNSYFQKDDCKACQLSVICIEYLADILDLQAEYYARYSEHRQEILKF